MSSYSFPWPRERTENSETELETIGIERETGRRKFSIDSSVVTSLYTRKLPRWTLLIAISCGYMYIHEVDDYTWISQTWRLGLLVDEQWPHELALKCQLVMNIWITFFSYSRPGVKATYESTCSKQNSLPFAPMPKVSLSTSSSLTPWNCGYAEEITFNLHWQPNRISALFCYRTCP